MVRKFWKILLSSLIRSVALDDDGYKSVGALVVASLKIEKYWVKNSGFSYHLYRMKEYFET